MAAIRLPRRLSQPHKQVEERRATSFLGLILPLVRRIPLSRVRIHAPLAPLGRLRRAIAQASQKARQLGGKPILKKHTRPPAPTPVENICSSDVGPDKTKVAGSGPAQEARTAAAEHDVAELEKRAAAAEHDVAELEKRAVAAEREVAKLQNRAAAAQRDVAAAAARAEGAQQAYVKVVDRLLQAEAAVVAASARAVAAEGRAREAERAGNDIARQLPLVQRDLHHAQAEVASERAYADQTLEKHNEQQAELRRIIDAWAERERALTYGVAVPLLPTSRPKRQKKIKTPSRGLHVVRADPEPAPPTASAATSASISASTPASARANSSAAAIPAAASRDSERLSSSPGPPSQPAGTGSARQRRLRTPTRIQPDRQARSSKK